MLAAEIIRAKRDGAVLTGDAIVDFVGQITDGSATDAQIAALAMAVFFNGMNRDETIALTMAMRDSGDVLDWSGLDRPVADKHSTGGVGDNVSLMLAPMAAACGLAVPMISGRGLGHTGGTLDKMEAIPGYQTQPDNETFRKTVADMGCAIIGQTANLAPADKRFYGVRDVTATVENLSLITASILSKKLAAGLGALVLDVKCGSGAFMAEKHDALALAESLVAVANGAGTKTSALVTDMNEPLASAAGKAVEVENAVRFLTGDHRDERLEDVTVALVGEMLVAAGVQATPRAGQDAARKSLGSGAAAETFDRMVHALGGPSDFIATHRQHLPQAPLRVDIAAPRSGIIQTIDTRALGMAVVELGGGRRRREDDVDPAVGLIGIARIGAAVEKGDPLAVAHLRDEAQVAMVRKALEQAMTIGDEPPPDPALILERIGA
jgi:thymidine phosphorylase